MNTRTKPGSNWANPDYLFDFFCEQYGMGPIFLDAFSEALRIAKRIVALGAFDTVEDVFDAATERMSEAYR